MMRCVPQGCLPGPDPAHRVFLLGCCCRNLSLQQMVNVGLPYIFDISRLAVNHFLPQKPLILAIWQEYCTDIHRIDLPEMEISRETDEMCNPDRYRSSSRYRKRTRRSELAIQQPGHGKDLGWIGLGQLRLGQLGLGILRRWRIDRRRHFILGRRNTGSGTVQHVDAGHWPERAGCGPPGSKAPQEKLILAPTGHIFPGNAEGCGVVTDIWPPVCGGRLPMYH